MKKTYFAPYLSNRRPKKESENNFTTFLESNIIDNCIGNIPLSLKNGTKTIHIKDVFNTPNKVVMDKKKGILKVFSTFKMPLLLIIKQCV